MCIALLTTAHPDYALILISNRDEFLSRPTAPANWWAPPNESVLGGRDLLREEQGTWLGITRHGRLAVLTNFREEGQLVHEAKSRGGIVNSFLTGSVCTHEFIEDLFTGDALKNVGGFSLICGIIGEPLAMVSNRTSNINDVQWIGEQRDETIGLSNAAIGDRSWPKVIDGEKHLKAAVQSSISRKEDRGLFVDDLLNLLSTDTLPKWKKGQNLESFGKELKRSIFIPVLGGEAVEAEQADRIAAAGVDATLEVESRQPPDHIDGLSGLYGTQKQTVILVDHEKRVYFMEKTLRDPSGRSINEENVKDFEFEVSRQTSI